MTRVAIIGGKLQGVEAVYLASKAGMETVVIDKKDNVPARELCDVFLCNNVLEKNDELINELKKADFILPALENKEVLVTLLDIASEYNLNLAFDLNAYNISSSKLLSDKLFHENNIPAPQYYPNCKSPYIVKPSSSSGSEGVKYIKNANQLETFLKNIPTDENWVVQEFLSGRSYSIEIIGTPGEYKTYEITEIIVDEVYDCKRVEAPCNIHNSVKKQLKEIALKIAEILQLKGIMDVEVIDDKGILKVLEIDARFPSQTPTVVYHSSGINLVDELRSIFCGIRNKTNSYKPLKYVSYEHLLIGEGKVKTFGEHIMGVASPLSLKYDFCNADEVITDYKPGSRMWRGTFINIANSEQELIKKRSNMLNEINLLQGEKLEYIDLSPWC